jgi:hypothetical protein
MTNALTPEDIRTLLNGLSVAIELDQVYVDSLPPERFSPMYTDGMWRDWRRNHRKFIDRLLLSVDSIPPLMLRELSRIAVTHKAELVGRVLLELFADVASGSCSVDDLGTSRSFFGSLVNQTKALSNGDRHESARVAILRWLPLHDPLRIARDPECGYGQAKLAVED